MKLLFHISSLYGGGAERVMANLINHNIELHNEVIVVICYIHENEYPISSKAKKIVLKSKNILKQSKELRKILKTYNPDLSISFMQGGNFRMVISNLFSKRKYILSIRNDPKKEYPNLLGRIFAKTMFKKATGVVFQTQDAQKYFSYSIQNKSKVIFNPVDNKFFLDNREKKVSNIVALGRLTEQKNFKLLINAFNLIKEITNENLLIYGEGELKEELQKLIKRHNLENRVFLMGRTNDTVSVLKSAKLFVLSSDFEGMPNALLEAVCMLVPSISTDCPCGGSRIILKNNSGILVPINDENGLSKAMLNVLTDSSLQKELSDNCKIIRNEFDTKNILNQWDNFFNFLLEK